ncbi:hypothetical protein [Desmospora profundinema]|uniref:Uncharacterized protein n=1 Tax=Desmospora profundinema TaxID=1571184 RepID=A0ABU1IQG6_9BACL|nr:hypothetical protein [Desmospora profundinema]MDR6227037.1 hypothetical protein [Desmospora profundinema]
MTIKDAFGFYISHLGKILTVAITLVFPIQLFCFIFSMIVSLFYDYYGIFGAVFNMFLFLTCLFLSQVPFIQLMFQDVLEGEVELKQLYKRFFQLFFPVLMMSILFGIAVVIGLTFLIIPGIILFLVLFLFPYSDEGLARRGSARGRGICHYGLIA